MPKKPKIIEKEKIKIADVQIGFQKKKSSIENHPYTLALKNNNKKQYEAATASSKHQRKKESASWEAYLALRTQIQREGYKPRKDPIVVKWNGSVWYCRHGKHRICLLFDLYGPETVLMFDKTRNRGSVWEIMLPKKDIQIQKRNREGNCKPRTGNIRLITIGNPDYVNE